MRDRLVQHPRVALLAAVVVTLAMAALWPAAVPVRADYRGPDENTSQAYGPLQGGHTYAATLNQSGSNPGDQDWYYFYVSRGGERLHWTVSNTNSPTACPRYECNVYATLEDASGHQLGGAGSSAGTSGVAPGTTQTIDWAYPRPGKYYIAFIGDGPTIAYQFGVTPADALSGSPPAGTSLALRAHQSGRELYFALLVPSGGARLVDGTVVGRLAGSRVVIGSLRRDHVAAGSRRFAIRLSRRGWRALQNGRRLRVTLVVTLTRPGGERLRARRVLVLR